MKKICLTLFFIPFLVNAQYLTENTTINIEASWAQEPNGFTYPIAISMPSNTVTTPDGGFPICILLHGNGGNGEQIINQFSNILECHVLVAPSGYLNSWNLCSEESDAPDLDMIMKLVDTLQQFQNINPNKIRVLGFSNGAGLANSVYIENNNPGIDIVCAIVSHLNEAQYHAQSFYKIANITDSDQSYCGYTDTESPLSSRKYLSISNDNDPIIPYQGGTSIVGVDFLHAEDAAFAIAQNQGYTDTKISGMGNPTGNPVIFEYDYLAAGVMHIRGNAQHSMNSTQEEYISYFFEDCVYPLGINAEENNPLKIYPNPFEAIITIENSSSKSEIVKVYSTLGDLILSQKTNSNSMDLSSLSEGVYILNIGNKFSRIFKTK